MVLKLKFDFEIQEKLSYFIFKICKYQVEKSAVEKKLDDVEKILKFLCKFLGIFIYGKYFR